MKQTHRPTHKRRGFTVVELVIVIAVIAILAMVLVPTFGNVINNAKDSAAMQDAKNAYTEYMVGASADGTPAAYMLYEADGRFVTLEQGAATGVYHSQSAALTAMLDDPDTPSNEAEDYVSVPMTDRPLHICRKDFSKLTYVAFGDSITYGIDGNSVSGADRQMAKPYPALVKELLDFGTVTNKGVSSATLCSLNSNSSLNMTDTILAYNEKADIISVLLGVNDYYPTRNFPLGQLGSNDKKTVYGSLNQIANHLTQNYPDALIFFMTPFPCRSGEQVNRANPPYRLSDVADAIKSVAAQYGIPVLDLYANGKYELEMSTNANDGIHPSQQHHINYTAPLIAEFVVNNYDADGNYPPENGSSDNNTPPATPTNQTLLYSKQELVNSFVKVTNNSINKTTNNVHKHFTVPAAGIDSITITSGGSAGNAGLYYVIHEAADGTIRQYAPINSTSGTVTIDLGGTATGTLYFNYFTDNAIYVKEATIVWENNG